MRSQSCGRGSEIESSYMYTGLVRVVENASRSMKITKQLEYSVLRLDIPVLVSLSVTHADVLKVV